MSNIIYNPEKQIDYRREGKLQRRELTDQIKNLVAFAKEHHSQNADWYYAAFGKLLKKQLNLPDTSRDQYTIQQIIRTTVGEQVLTTALELGLRLAAGGEVDEKFKDSPHKQAYIVARDRLKQFVELIGEANDE